MQRQEAISKKGTFNPVPEQRVFEVDEVVTEEYEKREEEEEIEEEVQEETGFRQQGGRVTCIFCGLTRNTKSQMNKHMQQQKDEGEIVPAWQVHCALVAYYMCPFQCSSKDELIVHIENKHKRQKCNFCKETFETKEGM